MNNVALLAVNAAAALDKTMLTRADREVFKQYAQATRSSYCAGCAYICDSVLPDTPYVSDVIRYLMYYNSYGEEDRAKELFTRIPTVHEINCSMWIIVLQKPVVHSICP